MFRLCAGNYIADAGVRRCHTMYSANKCLYYSKKPMTMQHAAFWDDVFLQIVYLAVS
jgi:hypothetical protein